VGNSRRRKRGDQEGALRERLVLKLTSHDRQNERARQTLCLVQYCTVGSPRGWREESDHQAATHAAGGSGSVASRRRWAAISRSSTSEPGGTCCSSAVTSAPGYVLFRVARPTRCAVTFRVPRRWLRSIDYGTSWGRSPLRCPSPLYCAPRARCLCRPLADDCPSASS
jgi:hypothetical protein